MQGDYVVEIPLFNPAILEGKGNFISRDLLPSKWVLDGASACLIAEELKEGDDNAFLEDHKSRPRGSVGMVASYDLLTDCSGKVRISLGPRVRLRTDRRPG